MKFISKLSQRERMFFYIVTAIVTLFLVDRFIFSTMVDQVNQLDERIRSLKDELVDNKNVLSYKDKISKERDIYGKYLAKEDNPNLELQKTVSFLANQAELLSPEYKAINLKDNKYAVELSAEGKMKNVVNFMYNLNTVQSLLKVEKIDLSPKAAKSEMLKVYILISKTIVQ
jgi:hypothetical protein